MVVLAIMQTILHRANMALYVVRYPMNKKLKLRLIYLVLEGVLLATGVSLLVLDLIWNK